MLRDNTISKNDPLLPPYVLFRLTSIFAQNLRLGSNELEKKGVKLKVTSAMLKGGNSVSNLFRRGSRRLSTEGGMDDALQMKHNDDIKKADHLRKKLRVHHDEARTVLAKKLQVENAR